ncbi:MAG: hypothetical protein LBF60_02475 [Treponema sp.]|nr:hypothetical protein [Treponema sp.]
MNLPAPRGGVLDPTANKEADFIEWSENLIDMSSANAAGWKLPQDKLNEIKTLHGEAKRLHFAVRWEGGPAAKVHGAT